MTFYCVLLAFVLTHCANGTSRVHNISGKGYFGRQSSRRVRVSTRDDCSEALGDVSNNNDNNNNKMLIISAFIVLLNNNTLLLLMTGDAFAMSHIKRFSRARDAKTKPATHTS